MYHWFRPRGVASGSRSPQLEITPELFERQLALLRRTGHRSLRLSQAVRPRGADGQPRRPVVITFDDGTQDFWEHARPLLAKHGFSATLFVVTGRVGSHSNWDRELGEPDRPLMGWDQIRRLHDDGFEIGSHTHSHRLLTELSDREIRSEMERSRRVLVSETGVEPEFLAYPRGRFIERHKQLAREAGYTGACAVVLRWSDLWRSEPYALRRMTVKGTESMLHFRLRLALGRFVRHSQRERPASRRAA
jgi:peptidoglycan/xylan/chitin deacetylase (PgdA/CDA1 family)